MRRVALVLGVITLVSLAAAGHQPPVAPPAPPPTPPRTLPPDMSSAPVPPAAAASETPLAQFEPLSAFPVQTQNAVRGVLLGAQWMTRTNQPQGRFLFGYNPALRQPLPG